MFSTQNALTTISFYNRKGLLLNDNSLFVLIHTAILKLYFIKFVTVQAVGLTGTHFQKASNSQPHKPFICTDQIPLRLCISKIIGKLVSKTLLADCCVLVLRWESGRSPFPIFLAFILMRQYCKPESVFASVFRIFQLS